MIFVYNITDLHVIQLCIKRGLFRFVIQEEGSLVQFILLSSPQKWPIVMTVSWEKASEFVHNYCQSSGYSVKKRTSKHSLIFSPVYFYW